jgi:hypothetical protein
MRVNVCSISCICSSLCCVSICFIMVKNSGFGVFAYIFLMSKEQSLV